LIHLVGDVHQPLHAVARFTANDLDGDSGGTDVNIHCNSSLGCEDNLHAEWDHILGDGEAFSGLQTTATTLDSGPAPADIDMTDVEKWIQESVTLAKTHAYKKTNGTRIGDPDAMLNQAYITRAQEDARQRIRLAGRRLAKLINDALGS
jgi:S1/P1 Nuclease